jgi:hypothetical protein
LARLIRERPVSVNVARCRIRASSKRRNFDEYIDLGGVFQNEDGPLARDPEPANMGDP